MSLYTDENIKPEPVMDLYNIHEVENLVAENAALKQQVEQGKRDAVPEGWCFCHADFSMQAGGKSETGTVSFIRDMAGRKWWHALSEEQQEDTPLYIYGNGATVQEAIDAAIAAAPKQEK